MSTFDTARRPTVLSMLIRDPDEIIKDLYLGGLAAATNNGWINALGITHILSVCPECSGDVPTRMAIHIDDNPQENLLIRLPEACEFIEKALDRGGKIYVHCGLGVSRSVTVVCAYLMKSRGMSTQDALEFVKSKRPVARPNFGFLQQLDVWKACDFAPSVLHPSYSAWKHRQKEHGFPLRPGEPTQLDERLYMIEDLPQTPHSLALFLRRTSVTHLITMTPYQPIAMSESVPEMGRCHLNLADGLSDDLALHLPEAVNFIDHGLKESSETVVLIHSFDLTRICVVACAYWMAVRGIDSASALRLLEVGLPLYSPNPDFTAIVSLFEGCKCAPTPTHPEVIAFRARRKQEE